MIWGFWGRETRQARVGVEMARALEMGVLAWSLLTDRDGRLASCEEGGSERVSGWMGWCWWSLEPWRAT